MTTSRDEEIRNEVLDEISWDSRLGSSDVAVTVRDGIVTLLGVASSLVAKVAAGEAAHRVRGVLDVANEIEVKAEGTLARTDAEIAAAVRRALEWDALIDDRRIRSTVSHGWVTLTGDVDRLCEREDAERAIRHLAGVRGVTNAVEIVGPPVDPQRVRQAIESALERHAEREAKHIRVRVSDHTVTLSGKVDSWVEKRAVLGIVGHIAGVRSVNDGLDVEPYIATTS